MRNRPTILYFGPVGRPVPDLVRRWATDQRFPVEVLDELARLHGVGEQVAGIYEADYRDFNRETYIRGRETFDATYAMVKRLVIGAWRRDELARAAEAAEGR